MGSGPRPPARRQAVVAAVAAGGVITSTAARPGDDHDGADREVVNAHPRRSLDGGGKVTLSGGGKRRILYQNTCDQAQVLHHLALPGPGDPRLVVQNLTFADGNATGETSRGRRRRRIFVRGGRLKVIDSRFVRQPLRPDRAGPRRRRDPRAQPVPTASRCSVVGSTFTGGAAPTAAR